MVDRRVLEGWRAWCRVWRGPPRTDVVQVLAQGTVRVGWCRSVISPLLLCDCQMAWQSTHAAEREQPPRGLRGLPHSGATRPRMKNCSSASARYSRGLGRRATGRSITHLVRAEMKPVSRRDFTCRCLEGRGSARSGVLQIHHRTEQSDPPGTRGPVTTNYTIDSVKSGPIPIRSSAASAEEVFANERAHRRTPLLAQAARPQILPGQCEDRWSIGHRHPEAAVADLEELDKDYCGSGNELKPHPLGEEKQPYALSLRARQQHRFLEKTGLRASQGELPGSLRNVHLVPMTWEGRGDPAQARLAPPRMRSLQSSRRAIASRTAAVGTGSGSLKRSFADCRRRPA